MKMSNKMYDILKFIAQYVLPALATCIATIFKIWNLPYGVEISATIMAVDTTLGVILGISTYNYNKELK
ncbi:MAG: phage holin [Bacilli bacterium]|nr:phage holin [Bacilli bacterium]